MRRTLPPDSKVEKNKYTFTVLKINPKTKRVELEIKMKTKLITLKSFKRLIKKELARNPNYVFDYDGSLK